MNSTRPTGPLQIKVFTREQPATKVDIAEAFWDGLKFKPCPVVVAWSIIGQNVPKYLLKKGLATLSEHKGVDIYTLTRAGQEWLVEGLQKHVKRHPSDRVRVDLERLSATSAQATSARHRRAQGTPAQRADKTPSPAPGHPTRRARVTQSSTTAPPMAGKPTAKRLGKPRIKLEK